MMKFSRLFLALALLLAPIGASSSWSQTQNQAGPGSHIPGPRGPIGPQGVQGIQGIQGIPGSTWTSGTGAPSGGNPGDFYFRNDTGQTFKNIAGTWTVQVTLLLPNGNGSALTGLTAGQISGLATSATTDTTNASNISSGTLGAARLPNPTLTTIGGIEAIAAVTHQWINSISTAGVPSLTQPAFTDLSGSLSSAQLPALTATDIWVGNGSSLPTAVALSGDCTLASSGAITCTKTSGTAFGYFATGTNAANLTGTVPAAALPNPSTSTLGGVQAINAVTSQWIRSISTAGIPQLSQPTTSDISGYGTNLGAASGTSLALGGATIGSNALAVTGSALLNGTITNSLGNMNLTAPSGGIILTPGSGGGSSWRFDQLSGASGLFNMGSTTIVGWRSSSTGPNGTADTGLSAVSAGVIGFGTGAAASTAGSWSATNGTLSGSLTSTGGSSTTAGVRLTSTGAHYMATARSSDTGNGTIIFDNATTTNLYFGETNGSASTFSFGAAGAEGAAPTSTTLNMNIATKAVSMPGSLALGGATIGSNALAVSGTSSFAGNVLPSALATYNLGSVTFPFSQIWTEHVYSDANLDLGAAGANGYWRINGSGNLVNIGSNSQVVGWSSGGSGTLDTGISRDGAGTFDFGNGTAQNYSGTLKAGSYLLQPGTALTSGGSATMCYSLSSTSVGFCSGTGTPTFSAAKGTLYTDNSGGIPYYNNNGTTGWTQIASGATGNVSTAGTITTGQLATWASGTTIQSTSALPTGTTATTQTTGDTSTAVATDQFVATAVAAVAGVPSGTVMMYTGVNAPAGYFFGYGQAVSRTTYASLLAATTSSSTVTMTIASPGVITWTAHGRSNGDPIALATTGALPTGLAAATTYYVVAATTNTFELATTPGGAAINTTGSQSGTHTATYAPYGFGDYSTTFNVADCRGRVLAGADALGGTAAGRLGSGSTGGITGPAVAGANGGEQSHTLTAAQQASMPVTVSVGGVVTTAGGTDIFSGAGANYGGPGTASGSGTATGSGGAHNVVQPTLVANCIVKQ